MPSFISYPKIDTTFTRVPKDMKDMTILRLANPHQHFIIDIIINQSSAGIVGVM